MPSCTHNAEHLRGHAGNSHQAVLAVAQQLNQLLLSSALLRASRGESTTCPMQSELPWVVGWCHGPPHSRQWGGAHRDKPSSSTLTTATARRAEVRSPKLPPAGPFSTHRTLQTPQNLHLLLELCIPPHWPEEAGK